jgi:hypothetical protein
MSGGIRDDATGRALPVHPQLLQNRLHSTALTVGFRTTSGRNLHTTKTAGIDQDLWSGRAPQEVVIDLSALRA